MATIATHSSANSTTSTTTLAAVGYAVSRGDWLACIIAADNAGTNGANSIDTPTDSSGGTWVASAGSPVLQDPGAASAGASVAIYFREVTVSETLWVTANFSPATVSKAFVVLKITPEAHETFTPNTASGSVTGSLTAGDATLLSADTAIYDVVIGAYGAETRTTATADSDTTNGSWTTQIVSKADTTVQGTSITLTTQQKILTAAGDQNYTWAIGTARDVAGIITSLVSFRPSQLLGTGGASPETYGGIGDSGVGSFGIAVGNRVSLMSYLLDAGPGSYSQAGSSASLLASRKLAAGAGSYSLSGSAASALKSWKLASGPGAYSLTGAGATLLASRKLAAGAGSYSMTGSAASLTPSRKLAAGAGSYSLTGFAATLANRRVLSASAGSYAITGADATLLTNRVFGASSAAYSITGFAATLRASRVLSASAGAYAITGFDVADPIGAVLNAEAGAYALTGFDATLLPRRILAANAGAYVVTGFDANNYGNASNSSEWIINARRRGRR